MTALPIAVSSRRAAQWPFSVPPMWWAWPLTQPSGELPRSFGWWASGRITLPLLLIWEADPSLPYRRRCRSPLWPINWGIILTKSSSFTWLRNLRSTVRRWRQKSWPFLRADTMSGEKIRSWCRVLRTSRRSLIRYLALSPFLFLLLLPYPCW